jgi:phosphosulfolactate synthase (CoM biosynthesis protein A)
MLNFKHGLYGNLFNTDGSNKVDISNGTIYVTTDEKAMYVDLDGKRIRLS